MNAIIGPLVVLLLGVTAGLVCHVVWRRFWVASLVAMLSATSLWVGGCHVLFALTAPGELGAPAFGAILFAILTAFAGALVAGCGIRACRSR